MNNFEEREARNLKNGHYPDDVFIDSLQKHLEQCYSFKDNGINKAKKTLSELNYQKDLVSLANGFGFSAHECEHQLMDLKSQHPMDFFKEDYKFATPKLPAKPSVNGFYCDDFEAPSKKGVLDPKEIYLCLEVDGASNNGGVEMDKFPYETPNQSGIASFAADYFDFSIPYFSGHYGYDEKNHCVLLNKKDIVAIQEWRENNFLAITNPNSGLYLFKLPSGVILVTSVHDIELDLIRYEHKLRNEGYDFDANYFWFTYDLSSSCHYQLYKRSVKFGNPQHFGELAENCAWRALPDFQLTSCKVEYVL